jgi:hypothetical protein
MLCFKVLSFLILKAYNLTVCTYAEALLWIWLQLIKGKGCW